MVGSHDRDRPPRARRPGDPPRRLARGPGGRLLERVLGPVHPGARPRHGRERDLHGRHHALRHRDRRPGHPGRARPPPRLGLDGPGDDRGRPDAGRRPGPRAALREPPRAGLRRGLRGPRALRSDSTGRATCCRRCSTRGSSARSSVSWRSASRACRRASRPAISCSRSRWAWSSSAAAWCSTRAPRATFRPRSSSSSPPPSWSSRPSGSGSAWARHRARRRSSAGALVILAILIAGGRRPGRLHRPLIAAGPARARPARAPRP